jgi:endoglucanase
MTQRLLSIASSITAALILSSTASAQLPSPCYGWNLGNTLESTWGFPPPTEALINSVANAGFNTVRIPCAWDFNSNQSTNQINPAYMAQVKQTVDWCLARNLHVVLNCHWDGGWLDHNLSGTVNPTINAKMNTYWSQIATAFAGYDNRLLFAAANEPPADNAAKMAELMTYYQTFINAVRSKGGHNSNRWLVFSGPNTDIDLSDSLMNTLPNDSTPGRMMVEVHYYTPYQFTLMSEDQSWGSMFYFWGNGYHSTTMPSRNATWGEEAAMDALFQKMKDKFTSKGIPVIIGEFGAYKRGNLSGADAALNHASTTYFNKTVVETAHRHGMSPIFWNTPGYLFDWTTGAVNDQLTIDSLTGRGALPPPGSDGSAVVNGTFKIVSRNGGKALEAAGFGTANGTQIQQWGYWGGSNQKWSFTRNSDGTYRILGVHSGKSLDIDGWQSGDGTKVQLWDHFGSANQKFAVTRTSDGYFRITPQHATGSCLDVSGYSTADGAAVHLWSWGWGANQQWAIQTP